MIRAMQQKITLTLKDVVACEGIPNDSFELHILVELMNMGVMAFDVVKCNGNSISNLPADVSQTIKYNILYN